MSEIGVKNGVATMINVFHVEPEDQKKLVALLVETTESVMRHVPGFVSANIHASVDGTRVVNYAQWESEEHIEAMLADPEVHPHFAEVRAIARPERGTYRVVYVEEANPRD
ncbi:antibiotic biosynthesis monooxygenase family protein [Catenuloplanes atrovinosus]|uniref:Quinol monooxygenase YgiN n=1 Tax=Catenuloplanes atrovinosus TaxID=137266 RepID=A0AAE4CA85_9ACTN|nr:antibiotic biosynthesis monooxygenase family protein [Catenuloplanes atrovinosus]MDR7276793.1 quinol monooxygenase YgiN [Catenuloplanes atrovinosus]